MRHATPGANPQCPDRRDGSGRHRPRNQFVARVLRWLGIATPLLDWLEESEERRSGEGVRHFTVGGAAAGGEEQKAKQESDFPARQSGNWLSLAPDAKFRIFYTFAAWSYGYSGGKAPKVEIST